MTALKKIVGSWQFQGFVTVPVVLLGAILLFGLIALFNGNYPGEIADYFFRKVLHLY